MDDSGQRPKRTVSNSPLVSGILQPLGQRSMPDPSKPPSVSEEGERLDEDVASSDKQVDEDQEETAVSSESSNEPENWPEEIETTVEEVEETEVIEPNRPEEFIEDVPETAVNEEQEPVTSLFFDTPTIEVVPDIGTSSDTGLWGSFDLLDGSSSQDTEQEVGLGELEEIEETAVPEPTQHIKEKAPVQEPLVEEAFFVTDEPVIEPAPRMEIIKVSKQTILTKRPCFQAFLAYEVAVVTAVLFWAVAILIWVTVDGLSGWLTAVLIITCLIALGAVATTMMAFAKCKREVNQR